jgi:hypothetical protein
MAMYFDIYGNPTKPKSASLIMPLLLALLASGGANYWLWQERVKLIADTNAATVKLAAAEGAQKELSDKLEKLEAERAGLIEAKEQAVKDAQAKALELAKLKDDGENDKEKQAGKEPETTAGSKAKPEAKDDRRAEAKAEVKEKPKGKPKKSTAGAPRRPRTDGGNSKASVEREL